MDKYEVVGELLKATITYLRQRPYEEVAGLIQGLQRSVLIKPPVGRKRRKKDEKPKNEPKSDEPGKTE